MDLERSAKRIVQVFNDRGLDNTNLQLLAALTVHHAGNSLDILLAYCKHVQEASK